MRQFGFNTFAAALALTAGVCANAATTVSTYVVNEHTSLFEIAIRLYGNGSLWPKIAKWNSIEEPNRIRIGQKLVLKEPPTLTTAQGNEAVLEYWRKRMHLGAARPSPAPVAVAAAASSPSPSSPRAVATSAPEPAAQEGPQELFDEGKRFFEQKNYDKALEKFRSSRVFNPDLLGSWLFEFSTLKHLDRNQEAQEISLLLLGRQPELRALPIFQDKPN